MQPHHVPVRPSPWLSHRGGGDPAFYFGPSPHLYNTGKGPGNYQPREIPCTASPPAGHPVLTPLLFTGFQELLTHPVLCFQLHGEAGLFKPPCLLLYFIILAGFQMMFCGEKRYMKLKTALHSHQSTRGPSLADIMPEPNTLGFICLPGVQGQRITQGNISLGVRGGGC